VVINELLQVIKMLSATSLEKETKLEAVRSPKDTLQMEVHRLADRAFRYHFISGYGEIENSGEYQIIYKGKPQYLALQNARTFLLKIMGRSEVSV
jgi:hypothetical protein